MQRCLNPFEFRAGLEPPPLRNMPASWRLNPFEFRAGLELEVLLLRKDRIVLIPLNSGLAWSSAEPDPGTAFES